MGYQLPRHKEANDEYSNDWGGLPWMDMVLLAQNTRMAKSLIHHWIWVDDNEGRDWENNYRLWGYIDVFRNVVHMAVVHNHGRMTGRVHK